MRRFDLRLSAVFPAYNEAGNIEALVLVANALLREMVRDFEIIVVDDGSDDGSAELVQQAAEHCPSARLVRHTRNQGYGAAIRDGIRAAHMEYVFVSDSDRQFDLLNLQDLLALVDRYDIVVGYRRRRRDPLLRCIASWHFNSLVHWLFGLPLRDVDCAFKVFRRSLFDEIRIESDRYLVNVEILAKALVLEKRIAQVPVTHLPRAAGVSKITPADVPRTLRELVRVREIVSAFRRDIQERRTAANVRPPSEELLEATGRAHPRPPVR